MVTSHDVARLVGVSQPTVSKALRDSPKVSVETRARVAAAARELGYVPSATGRALSVGRSNRIGLHISDLDNRFYPHVIGPMHRDFGTLGYDLVLVTDDHDGGNIADHAIANGLDGVVLATNAIDSPAPVSLRERGIPFVYFNRISTTAEADSVTTDASHGAHELVVRVAELGHTRLATVHGPETTSTALHRAAILDAELALAGLGVPEKNRLRGAFDLATGARAAQQLLGRPDAPTVILCGSDVVALGVINEAVSLGLRIPEDVSVVGFDDLPEASWPVFGLSTVAYDLHGMARSAAALLSDRIADPDGASFQHLHFPTRFVQRRSLGVAAVRPTR